MKKVLIVEPKAADARALQESLRDAGLNLASVVLKTAAEAKVHLAERDQECIVMLNIHAADGEGMALLDWLRRQSYCKKLLIVAVGERGHLRGVVDACERGANTFVIKPVHIEDFKTLARTYPDHWAPPP